MESLPEPDKQPARPRRRIRLVWALLGVVGLATLAYGVKVGRWYVFPRRFMAIEADLFRSAQMERGPYESVVEKHSIRNVLRLYSELIPRLEKIEDDILAKHHMGLKVVTMPGDGRAAFEDLDRAADIAADRSLRPLLLHCASGSRRSGAVHAAYRMKHCGWTWERTTEELVAFGLDRGEAPELYAHLERYGREHLKLGTGAPK